MKHKVENRYQGSDSDGMSFTVSQTPLVEQLQQSQPAALCQALFNFNPAEMNLEDSGSFLSFHKVGITNCILAYCLPLGVGVGVEGIFNCQCGEKYASMENCTRQHD